MFAFHTVARQAENFLKSDEERLNFAKEKFQNSITSKPGRKLTFHGFKRNQHQGESLEQILERKKKNFICNGKLIPTIKRFEVETRTRKMKISDVGPRMKEKIFSLFSEENFTGVSESAKEQLGLYLAHFKKGQEEQAEFLAYYSNTEVQYFPKICQIVKIFF